MATPTKRPENRLEFLALLGVPVVPDPAGSKQPKRNEDGSYPLPTDCPQCGAARFTVAYDKPAGIAGVICHVNHEGGGCRTRTEDALRELIADMDIQTSAPKPDFKSAPSQAEPQFRAEPSDPGLDYIRFRDPISCGRHGDIQSWARTKHPHIGVHIEGGMVTLSFGNERRRIPLHNVSYIADRVMQ